MKSFTLLEILFVIVILSILTGVALPKFMDTITSVNTVKLRSDIAMIRSDIIQYRDNQLLKSNSASYPVDLRDILEKLNIKSDWIINTDTYTVKLNNSNSIEFKYQNNIGIFDCLHKQQDLCQEITR